MKGAQLGLRERGLHAVLQPSDGAESEDGPWIVDVARLEGDGHPELRCRVRKGDTSGGDADDLAIDAVDQDLLAEHAGIAAEVLLPITVTQDDDVILTGLFFGGGESGPGRAGH